MQKQSHWAVKLNLWLKYLDFHKVYKLKLIQENALIPNEIRQVQKEIDEVISAFVMSN